MKKRILILIFCLATMLFTGLGLAGCDWLSGLDPNHEHKPSASWQGDETYHWHQCIGIGCTEQIDKAEHTLEHVEANAATCTEDGNVEYWHCTGCDKYYSDSSATTVIKWVAVGATGHSVVTKHDETTHWQECDTCHTITLAAEAHTATAYVKSAKGHYKLCTECGVRFDEASHVEGENCTVCGYTVPETQTPDTPGDGGDNTETENPGDNPDTPTQTTDYTAICSSNYGYNYLGTLENGANYQTFYKKMDEVAKSFHTDGTKNASMVTLSNGTAYVAGAVNYSSLGLTINEAQSVWSTYRHDHPLYYWLLGQVVYSTQTLSLCVDTDYISGTQRAAKTQEIYTAIDGYLKAVEDETSEYQIAFAFHDMIIDSIDYAYDESGNPETANYAHSIVGVLDGTAAVCEGYAKAYALLLNASGIENVYVTGSSKGVGHAWNMVKIDGGWYWYDLTWDDQPTHADGIIYTYMCQEGETFADHTVNTTGDTSTSINFLYEIPTAATAAYNTASIEYGEQFVLNNITYQVCGYNEVSIVSSSSLSGEVVLTSDVTYDGRTYTLTQIGTGAFTSNRKITSLTIPSTVTVIYNLAVNGCSRLNSVIFEDKVGWSRTSNNDTEQIAQTSLESTSSAATLLKETYKVLFTSYEYIWVKSPSE